MKTSGCWKVLGGQLVPAFYQYLPLFKVSKHARQEGGPPVDQHLLSRTPGPKNTLHHGHLCLWASKNWSDPLIALSGAQAKRNSSSGPGKPEPQRKESLVQGVLETAEAKPSPLVALLAKLRRQPRS